ncbi:MAG: TadE/TadG family type IV pilus assembly protein [Rhodothalassiaceae bacterium]
MLVETALVLPVLILLLAGAYELGNFMLANQKVSGVSSAMADLIAQTEDDVTESEINDIFGAIAYISEPFNVVAGGRVIISAIQGDSTNGNTVLWQRCRGPLTAASRVGTTGATDVTLPGNIALGDGETAVLAEVYFSYSPRLFIGFFPARQLWSEAIYRPRFGALANVVNDGATPSTCGGG